VESSSFNNFGTLDEVFVLKIILKLGVYKYMLNGQRELRNTNNHKLLNYITQPTETTTTYKRLHKLEQDKSVRQYSDVLYRYLLYFFRRGREETLNAYFGWPPMSQEFQRLVNDLFQACQSVVSLVIVCLEVSFLYWFGVCI